MDCYFFDEKSSSLLRNIVHLIFTSEEKEFLKPPNQSFDCNCKFVFSGIPSGGSEKFYVSGPRMMSLLDRLTKLSPRIFKCKTEYEKGGDEVL